MDPQDYPYVPNAHPVFSPTPATVSVTGGRIEQTQPIIGAPMNFLDENIDAPVWTSGGSEPAVPIVDGEWNPQKLGIHPMGNGPQADF